MKEENIYIYIYVCVCVRVCVRVCARVRVRAPVCVGAMCINSYVHTHATL